MYFVVFVLPNLVLNISLDFHKNYLHGIIVNLSRRLKMVSTIAKIYLVYMYISIAFFELQPYGAGIYLHSASGLHVLKTKSVH
jgi:hypothetical protein